MKDRKLRVPGEISLLVAAMIWGAAFVAQSLGADKVSPFTFNASRSLIGALFIAGMFLVNDKIHISRGEKVETGGKALYIGGAVCGLLLFFAMNLQQLGISLTEPAVVSGAETEAMEKANVGKAGFLTALYIVLVSLIGVFMKKKPGLFVWLGVLTALIGLYLLCIKPGFSVSKSDFYVILCAFAFSLQIIAVDIFAPKVDCLRLSCLQFLVCGVISSFVAVILEKPDMRDILSAWAPILFTGILSSGVAYTLQIIGQKTCLRPSIASLIMSLESVFSALFGFIILGQSLTSREFAGCAIMFAAVILAQIHPSKERKAYKRYEKA